MSDTATKRKLDSEWYGAKKKHYPPSKTIAWATEALKSAETNFAELASALVNRKKPIPNTFFKVFTISDSKCHPIFKLLRPRRIASLIEATSDMAEKVRAKLWTEIFKPYLDDWERILSIIENRLPGQAKVIELRQCFGAIFSLLHQMFSDPDLVAKETIKKYMDTFDNLWPIWEMMATILPVGRSINATAGSVRGKYNKYCFKNLVLADMFRVDLKTISRWKKEDSYWAERFRNCKDSAADMQKLAIYYKANREYIKAQRLKGRKAATRQSYDTTVDYSEQGTANFDYNGEMNPDNL